MRAACDLLVAGTQHMQNVEQVAQTLKRNDIDTLAQAWSPETINPHELLDFVSITLVNCFSKSMEIQF